jgi:hypothetical protein
VCASFVRAPRCRSLERVVSTFCVPQTAAVLQQLLFAYACISLSSQETASH